MFDAANANRSDATSAAGRRGPLAGVRVCLVPLGCPKNDVDAEYMLGFLRQAGAEVVDTPAAADVAIVNTCAFIQPAVEQAIETLLEAAEVAPKVICAGCLPQRYGRQLLDELPEVAGFIGPGAVADIVEAVGNTLAGQRYWRTPPPNRFSPTAHLPRVPVGRPWTHIIRIADGCNHRCTFCTVPAIRGPLRSRPADDVLREAEAAVARGAREICLVAQDTCSYGEDRGIGDGLVQLLRLLGRSLPADVWLRVQYLHPDRITVDLVETILETPQIVPYFDIPFQHAAGDVLRRMGRRGNAEAYHLTVATIRDACPDAAVRATFIVGFPGETTSHFHTMLDFLDLIQPDHTAIFPFWPEEGTAAAGLPHKIPLPEIRRRLEEAQETAQKIAQLRSERFVRRTVEVLVESRHGDGQFRGRTFRDAPEVDGTFFLMAPADTAPGARVAAAVNSADGNDLYGHVVP